MNGTLLHSLISWSDFIIYFYFMFSVFYLFIFAVFSYRKRRDVYQKSKKQYKYAVLFPSNGADIVIIDSVKSFLLQSYPKEKYDIVVVSENMKEETNEELKKLPIILLEAEIKKSSTARALEYAVNNLDSRAYDVVIIFEANNTVDVNFLEEINKAYHSGGMAIQTHRVAKSIKTNTSVLDAISEEMNNSIFRKGHVRMGFSGGLIGSGMALNYDWFKKNISKVKDHYIAKELEAKLLKQGEYIDYLDDVYTYAEKMQGASSFFKQRKEWISSQSSSFWHTALDFPRALFAANFDYCDKLLQWMMLPRSLLLAFTIAISVLLLFLEWTLSIKWWGLLLLLMLTFSLAIPEKFMNARTLKALISLPFLTLLMFFSLFGFRKKEPVQ
jgi:cellulose synthase/poly-beta-1,6-N-acetylglucosamine synthase-like glycosyltransferase